MTDLPFTLDQLRVLKAITVKGSFREAAKSLYVSQPAISLQIQNLEKQLNVALFDRNNRNAQLTEAGEILLEYGERILALCEESCRAIEDLQAIQGGTLVIGASHTTGTYLIPHLLGLFRHKYPQVTSRLQVHSTKRICWSVANGQVDLAIIGGEIPSELNGTLKIEKCAEDELVLIVPPSHPFCKIAKISKEDLYQLRFILLGTNSTIRQVIDRKLSDNAIDTDRFRVEMELSSVEAVKNAVQAELGVAFVSITSVSKELELGLLHLVTINDLRIKRVLSLVTHPHRYRSKAVETFCNEILALFQEPSKIWSSISCPYDIAKD
nr:LysR transcriptional regulator [Gronococcus sybilensis]